MFAPSPRVAPRATAPCSASGSGAARSWPSWPWTVLPAVGLATARRPAWCLVVRRVRLRAVGFGVQEASAEEQEEYDKEKAADAWRMLLVEQSQRWLFCFTC